ncbi:MAG: dual specificity protein phosphatase family protein [Candidatus Berkiella sp.]
MKDLQASDEPKTLYQKMAFTVTFYTGTLFPEFLGNSHWNHITDNLILGALPIATEISGMGNHRDKIIADCQARGNELGAVYSIVNDFEIKGENLGLTPVSPEDWKAKNVNHVLVPMDDFGGNMDINVMKKHVDDMHEVIESGKSVYVHCKAGKGRSFSFIVAYLLMSTDMDVTQIFGYLREKRPQVSPGKGQFELIEKFRAEFCPHKAPLDMNSKVFESYRKGWKGKVNNLKNGLINAFGAINPFGATPAEQSSAVIPNAPAKNMVQEVPPTLLVDKKRKASTQNPAKRQKRVVIDLTNDEIDERKPEPQVRSSERLRKRSLV